jgi:hypothetical protein
MYHKANMIVADQLKIRLPIAIALLSGMMTTPRGGLRKKNIAASFATEGDSIIFDSTSPSMIS